MSDPHKRHHSKRQRVSEVATERNKRKADRRSKAGADQWQGMSPGQVYREKKKLGLW